MEVMLLLSPSKRASRIDHRRRSLLLALVFQHANRATEWQMQYSWEHAIDHQESDDREMPYATEVDVLFPSAVSVECACTWQSHQMLPAG